MHNKSKYKQEGFVDRSQPGFRHISSYSALQTQHNSAAEYHCSHLSESRDCSINSCFSWNVEKKEECFLPSKEQKCGKGTRKLLYTCVDHNGVSFTLYMYMYHKLNYLKIKMLLPFDSMAMQELYKNWPQKRRKRSYVAHFSCETTESKEVASVLSWQIYDSKWT